jgi:glycerophosphoryl diester phosphodiesterase
MLIIGHRGCNYEGYNQNTLRSYKKVYEEGAPAFEFDVQKTIDNELIVVHNLDLSQVSTGSGLVSKTTLKEIQALWAGNPDQGKDKIPMLQEVFSFCASLPGEKRPVMHLELKGSGTGLPSGKLISSFIEKGLLRLDDFLVSSFNWDELKEIRSVCPQLEIALLEGAIHRKKLLVKIPEGLEIFPEIFSYGQEDYMLPRFTDIQACAALLEEKVRDVRIRKILLDEITLALNGAYYNQTLLDTAVSMKAVSVNLWFKTVNAEFVKKAHDSNLKVYVYTINEKEDIVHGISMGIDGFFTDFYKKSVEVVSRL